ncbi:BaiN/RdsA family NAD(P)/FAD-dependent oxidoreductase [Guggenheimella bovis]
MKIAIVGGGASGLFASILCSLDHQVVLYEKNDRVGKKLLTTGNGRCNYTNRFASCKDYHTDDPEKLKSVLEAFSPEQAIDLFRSLGVEPREEENGKLFPQSEQASSILDILRFEALDRDVNILTNTEVKALKKHKRGILVVTEEKEELFDRVIFSVGGKAMPQSGSDGESYKILEELGHSVHSIYPSLVQLMLEGDHFPFLDGVKIKGEVSLVEDDKVLEKEEGDILFTNYGISGPPVLQLSRTVARRMNQGDSSIIRVDLYARYTEEELRLILERRREELSLKPVESFLLGLVHKKVSGVILKELALDKYRPVHSLSDEELSGIIGYLKRRDFRVKGTKGFKSAQVTGGGIPLKEVTSTLESKFLDGLFITGEVLDVDGRSGGFNLQWAWSSAFVASMGAGRE